MREVNPVFFVIGKHSFSLLLILLLFTVPAMAQIDQQSPSSHKQQRKKFLKEANEAEAQYKETHLNVDTYTFKVGDEGRKRAKKDERARYQFNDAGGSSKKKSLFARKKKKKK